MLTTWAALEETSETYCPKDKVNSHHCSPDTWEQGIISPWRVYSTWLCVCVCLSIRYRYSATPGYKAEKERHPTASVLRKHGF